MFRQRMTTGAVCALALGLCVASASTAEAQSLSLRISGENPQTGNDIVMAQRFADNLAEELGDDFSYNLFHTQALGDESVHMQMIRTGQIDVYPMGSDAMQLDPKWAVFDMPFLFDSRETVKRILDGEVGEELRQSMRERANLEVLAFGELGFRQITNNVRPIVTPDDLSGLKIRVPGTEGRVLTFRSFGAQPITMNMGELYLGLQQGTVDGQENPLLQTRHRSFFEVQRYLSISNHVYTPVTLVMNGRKYDELSDEMKEIVRRAAQEAAEHSMALGEAADEELLAEFEGQMEINEVDLPAFREASEPVWDSLARVAGEDFTRNLIQVAQD